jgi:hypothetical protein
MADDNENIGSDFSAVTTVDASMKRIKGRAAHAQAVARRLRVPNGSKFYDLDYGFDLRQFVNAPAARFQIERGTELEALKDERTENADAVVTFEPIPGTTGARNFKVDLTLTDEAGPFDLTLNVDELDVTLFREFT